MFFTPSFRVPIIFKDKKQDDVIPPVSVAKLTILMEVCCYSWIASFLAMTVIMYRHCEEERRSNSMKNNTLNHFTSMVIINSIISVVSCITFTPVIASPQSNTENAASKRFTNYVIIILPNSSQ